MIIFKDLKSIKMRDPSAKSYAEILFLYPGYHAVIFYRISNKFYKIGFFFIARLISQICRMLTGIEMHPGAKIGNGLFIDHGMGVVIGESAIIGNNCTIYHGVTIGSTGMEISENKMHPIIGDNVLIGAGATVLGSINVGHNVKIGANSVVLCDIEPNSTYVGVPVKKKQSEEELKTA